MFKKKWATSLLLLLALVLLGWFSTGQATRVVQAEAASRYQELELFTDVLAIVRRSYVEEVPMKDLIYGAINGMLASLDPHSGFMPPEMYKEMKIDTSGEFGGVGIEITIKDGILTIVSPIEDTPAFRAGLQAGDQILKIEDRLTKDMGIMEAVGMMRGPKGSKVSVTIMRESFDKPREFILVREIIKIRSVRARTLEDGFGYVRIAQFQERTADDLQAALAGLRKENAGHLSGGESGLRPTLLLEPGEDELDVLAGAEVVGGVVRARAVIVAGIQAAYRHAVAGLRLRVADAKLRKERLVAPIRQPERLVAPELTAQRAASRRGRGGPAAGCERTSVP